MKRRSPSTWAVIFVLLVAAALRFYRLTAQSFWADEGNSISLAQRSLALVTHGAAHDIHPPLYYYLLWGWVRIFGDGEFAVRALSAVLGVAVVYVTWLLGCRLSDRRAGLVAGLLAAVSPYQVYYSQEARMYILVALLGALSAYFFARLLEDTKQERRVRFALPACWALITAGGFYTHYSFPVIVLVENVVFILWLVRTRLQGLVWRRLIGWAGLQMAVLALYAPWLPTAYRQVTSWPALGPAYGPGFIAGEALRLLSLGETVRPGGATNWPLAGFALLFLLGLFPGKRSQRDSTASLFTALSLALHTLAPALLMMALSLMGRPAYRPKFFLVASPAFCVVLARGVLVSWGLHDRWLRMGWVIVAAVFVGATSLVSLHNYYFDASYARDDYRGIAHTITEMGRPGDAILLNAPNQWEVVNYYYRGDAPLYPLARSRPLDPEQTIADLEGILAQHDRLFVLYWAAEESDPTRFIETWLDAHTYKALDTWYGRVRLAIYAVPRTASTADMCPLDVRLGQAIALRGYALLSETIAAGDILQLTLFWEALEIPPARYKVFVQVLDAQDNIVGQHDGEPGGGLHLTINWKPGEQITDNYGVLIRPDTPPGRYRLVVGMYDLLADDRLVVFEGGEPRGDSLLLTSVEIQ
ncbi:MAG: glycosyltransferase family 39 protein [Chloroflexota bacterium]|nr:glycosyltransferase family 39 protein [Chloroflexota bacterium]